MWKSKIFTYICNEQIGKNERYRKYKQSDKGKKIRRNMDAEIIIAIIGAVVVISVAIITTVQKNINFNI